MHKIVCVHGGNWFLNRGSSDPFEVPGVLCENDFLFSAATMRATLMSS